LITNNYLGENELVKLKVTQSLTLQESSLRTILPREFYFNLNFSLLKDETTHLVTLITN